MPRFFVCPNKISKPRIVIDTEDVTHISKVLRLIIGDEIEICDGQGTDYLAKIEDINSQCIECFILSEKQSDTEPNIEVTLFQAIPKTSKMEYIIQKTTELGVTRIVPCQLSRCVSKLDGKEQKKTERWRKIAQSAAKQSGRGRVTEITEVVDFQTAVKMLKENDLYFAPYECETQTTLKFVLTQKQTVKTVGFMIGPEGGYDLSEIAILSEQNVPTVTLGPRILRTETAGEAVLAMIMYEIGDINKNA